MLSHRGIGATGGPRRERTAPGSSPEGSGGATQRARRCEQRAPAARRASASARKTAPAAVPSRASLRLLKKMRGAGPRGRRPRRTCHGGEVPVARALTRHAAARRTRSFAGYSPRVPGEGGDRAQMCRDPAAHGAARAAPCCAASCAGCGEILDKLRRASRHGGSPGGDRVSTGDGRRRRDRGGGRGPGAADRERGGGVQHRRGWRTAVTARDAGPRRPARRGVVLRPRFGSPSFLPHAAPRAQGAGGPCHRPHARDVRHPIPTLEVHHFG